ncbi:MAG: hypothetical protein ACRDKL_07330, partial [Solirubrobacteraceae bacterium]
MRRLPALAFAALAAATVFAFFLTQALKSEPAVMVGNPAPVPAAFNPLHGRECLAGKQQVDYGRTQLTL